MIGDRPRFFGAGRPGVVRFQRRSNMPRVAGLNVPGSPWHIIQRGNNRSGGTGVCPNFPHPARR